MDYLYAPWRGMYAVADAAKKQKGVDGKSPFTMMFAAEGKEREHYILKRLQHTVILLNLYPYNPGHVLVVPVRQVASLDKLSRDERSELFEAIAESARILEQVLRTNAINVGFNLGSKESGGSIPEHVHAHVIPRWPGDTGFLPIIASVKPLSEDLNKVYENLLSYFDKIKIEI